MPTYEQTPIRLQFSLASNPPAYPLDANTGNAPRLWRSSSASIAIGIFDALSQPLDLSNVAVLQLVIQKAYNILTPLVVKTLITADFLDMTTAGWRAGTEQQATFVLTPADTDQGLGAAEAAGFWVALQGRTISGAVITYGAGPLTIFDAGTMLPSPLAGYVSRHRQNWVSGDIAAVPTSNNHTEIVDVSGASSVRGIVLPIPGIADGALLRLIAALPTIPGITLNVYSGTLSGPIIATIATTVSAAAAVAQFYYDADAVTWVLYGGSTTSGGEPAVVDSDGNPVTDSDGQAVTTTPLP